MTEAIFYPLKHTEDLARFQFACRIVAKAVSQGHRVHIHTDNEQHSKLMDELLWSYKADSFLPHEVIPSESANTSEQSEHPNRITIGHTHLPSSHREVLINLSSSKIEESGTYNRLCEIFCGNEEAVILGRERYRYYKGKGHQLASHPIG